MEARGVALPSKCPPFMPKHLRPDRKGTKYRRLLSRVATMRVVYLSYRRTAPIIHKTAPVQTETGPHCDTSFVSHIDYSEKYETSFDFTVQ